MFLTVGDCSLGLGHGKTKANRSWWLCLPCAQSEQWAGADLSRNRRLRGFLTDHFPSPQTCAGDAASLVLPDAQSLAPRSMASERRRTFGFRSLADAHAHPPLARPSPKFGSRKFVSGPLQVVSDCVKRSLFASLPLCGAKCVAGGSGGSGSGLALGKSGRSSGNCRGATVEQGAVGFAEPVVEACESPGNRGGIGIGSSQRKTRPTVWKRRLGEKNLR